MAYEVRWSILAQEDLKHIGAYISYDSPLQASLILEKFLDLIPGYGLRPRAATVVPELGDERFRHKHVYNWRVIYEIVEDNKVIIIHAIIHNKKLFTGLSDR